MVFLEIALWVLGFLFTGLLIWNGFKRSKDNKTVFRPLNAIGAVFVFFSIFFITQSIGQIPAGYRGVVLKFGATTGEIKDEGFYTIFPPFIYSVERMLVQVQAYETGAGAASRDLQVVKTAVTLNYSLDPAAVAQVYRDLRYDYVDRIIKPAIQEAVKASTAKFTAEELISERPDVRDAIENTLEYRLNQYGILVRAMSITDFDFSNSFNDAIEAKVTAQQQAFKAERDLDRIKTEAQQKIEQAKAEAESLRIQKENVTDKLIELRRIEAQMKAIEKWDGHMPDVVTGDGPVPLLDVFKRPQ